MKSVRCRLLGFLPLLLFLTLAQRVSASRFEIHRGVNIAHWLSQSSARGAERDCFFTEEDVSGIAAWGFDHVRIPIDEEQMFLPDGRKDTVAFALLHRALDQCLKYHLRVVVDLHILRSHYFDSKVKPLFTDKAAQETFCNCWRQLSGELKGYPVSQVAYELMNEPVADDPSQWNNVAMKCYHAVRALEKNRTIVLGSNLWQSTETVKYLEIPPRDKHIFISVHYYQPFLLTHYRASWNENKNYTGPVHYPGPVITETDLQTLPADMAEKWKWWSTQTFNLGHISDQLKEAVVIARKHHLPIYCGEYGCLYNAPDADRYRWLEDVNAAFEELGVSRAVWCYKENGFGIINDRGTDDKMIAILTGRK